jgi:nitrate reductase alpha subunit
VETNNAAWKTLVYDDSTSGFAVPHGSIGFRWGENGKWNLHMQDMTSGAAIEPRLSMLGVHDGIATVQLPYFDGDGKQVLRRAVPVKMIVAGGKKLMVTTVYDMTLANYGVPRGLGDDAPDDFEERKPYTPAWQEAITGIDRKLALRIAREFAQNAIDTEGRSMIIVGAGINHWYNSDTIYRAILNLVLMVGAQGVNGGGWAHYVGQEKLRPAEGWSSIAFARDWSAPPRHQNGTSFFYFATDQWRYEETPVHELVSPLAGKARYGHYADYNALAARLGWLPSYPQFNRNALQLADEAAERGQEPADYIVDEL